LLVFTGLTPRGGVRGQHPRRSAHGRKVSGELVHRINKGRGDDLVSVIVRPTEVWNDAIDSAVNSSGATTTHRFRNSKLRVLKLPASAAAALSLRDDVSYVALDKEVRTLGHLSVTTGADAARESDLTAGPVDGTGIGIAVLDSGIDPDHQAFAGATGSRIIVNQDFTGESRTDDPYGHGTHVASIAAGNGLISNGKYRGVAPNANLINLRVLNSDGVGSVSGVLDALDWIISNRATY